MKAVNEPIGFLAFLSFVFSPRSLVRAVPAATLIVGASFLVMSVLVAF